jgi:4-hydroxy-tetrahydrodipicolinate synthase
MGADGWVAGLVCAFPKETVAIYRLVKAGHIAEAQKNLPLVYAFT